MRRCPAITQDIRLERDVGAKFGPGMAVVDVRYSQFFVCPVPEIYDYISKSRQGDNDPLRSFGDGNQFYIHEASQKKESVIVTLVER